MRSATPVHGEFTSLRDGPGGSAFEICLRTGRRTHVEVKFNPWHDPDDGRFTFVGNGRYFPGGRGARTTDGERGYERFNPRNPRNHTIHVVKRGDTLSRIAKLRNGLRASDIAWLNNIRDADSLRVGQRLLLPSQAYLDAGRRARANLINLAFYVETHGGRLPSDITRVPSIEEQLNSNWRSQVISGYTFHSDTIFRPRRINGRLTHSLAERRSRRLQTRAGGADRRATDDGGHYIARRFNGPRDALNHFAQNRGFNRGAYRVLEDTWARHLRAGRSVFVDIIPQYEGTSLRPSSIVVLWHVDGQRYRDEFPNEKRESTGGRK